MSTATQPRRAGRQRTRSPKYCRKPSTLTTIAAASVTFATTMLSKAGAWPCKAKPMKATIDRLFAMTQRPTPGTLVWISEPSMSIEKMLDTTVTARILDGLNIDGSDDFGKTLHKPRSQALPTDQTDYQRGAGGAVDHAPAPLT